MDDFTENVGNVSAALTPAATRDASLRVAGAMGWRARLGDVGRFARRPTFATQPMVWGRAAALALAVVFALDLLLGELTVWLTGTWDEAVGFLPEPIEQDISLAEELFTGLVLAPVLEELLFRGWLTGRIAALRFALYGMAAMACFLGSFYAEPDLAEIVGLAGVAIAFAGLVHWSYTRHRDTAVPAWFILHFHWFAWGSTLLFGLLHIGNYEPVTHPLGVLVVLPQTIGGLLLAYTRTRLGLGAAMAHHAAFNAVFFASDYGWW